MENINCALEELAALFANGSNEGDEIISSERLDRSRLNYSLESLGAVDDYLAYLHENRPQRMAQQWDKSILRCGAYVGEVIRRNSSRSYNWVDFDLFVRDFPRSKQLLGSEKTLACCALLSVGGGQFTLPINKVIKFIHNGEEDSVWFYASAESHH